MFPWTKRLLPTQNFTILSFFWLFECISISIASCLNHSHVFILYSTFFSDYEVPVEHKVLSFFIDGFSSSFFSDYCFSRVALENVQLGLLHSAEGPCFQGKWNFSHNYMIPIGVIFRWPHPVTAQVIQLGKLDTLGNIWLDYTVLWVRSTDIHALACDATACVESWSKQQGALFFPDRAVPGM